ncbi:MAG: histidinol-phosphate transaminase [Coriobacteriales bacterium]|nr:histidinol-phosphate transaminase [Coriobacteriales bacterium]
MDRVRPVAPRLTGLKPYDPHYLASRIYLNANESPFDMPKPVRERLEGFVGAASLHRYPDPLAHELVSALAREHGVTEECVLVGNGGDELLLNILLAFGGAGRTMLDMPPTFSVYAFDALLTSTQVVSVARLPVADAPDGVGAPRFKPDVASLHTAARGGEFDVAFVTSPNNPTGECVEPDDIRALLEATDALVVVDHAYIEFADGRFDMSREVAVHKNLAVLRTFSKAYGLAGLRVGYLIASPEVVGALRAVRQPYSVNSLSAFAARAALEERAAYAVQLESLRRERERLFASLRALGVAVAPSEANYLLMRVPDAPALWQALHVRYGILVRDVSALPALAGCLRVTVGTRQENDLFLAALAALLEGGS